MLFRVDYQELVTYQDFIEADSKEEAYKQFYAKLDEDELEPAEVQLDDFEITEAKEEDIILEET